MIRDEAAGDYEGRPEGRAKAGLKAAYMIATAKARIIAVVLAEGDPAKGNIIKHETIEEVYNIILGLELSSLWLA